MKGFWKDGKTLIISILLIFVGTFVVFLLLYNWWFNCERYNPDFGGLIGGSISGLVTLIAVLTTLSHNSKQNNKIRENSVKPWLYIKQASQEDYMHSNTQDGVKQLFYPSHHRYVPLGPERPVEFEQKLLNDISEVISLKSLPKNRATTEKYRNEKLIGLVFEIENVGTGPAVKMKYTLKCNQIVSIDGIRKNISIDLNKDQSLILKNNDKAIWAFWFSDKITQWRYEIIISYSSINDIDYETKMVVEDSKDLKSYNIISMT